MSGKRIMLVTVGASIFHSASWRDEGPLKQLGGYSLWLQESYLRHPARRQAMVEGNRGQLTGVLVSHQLGELLKSSCTGRAFDDVQDCFADDGLNEPLRYSAELTTIFKLWRKRSEGLELRDFLRRDYERVDLLCSSDIEDRSHVAAAHLSGQIRRLAGDSLRIAVRGKIDPYSLIDSFESSLKDYENSVSVDLIVSGGYKAYAVIAGARLRWGWTAFYLHEDGSELFRYYLDSKTGRVKFASDSTLSQHRS